jgi:hypothetical protein
VVVGAAVPVIPGTASQAAVLARAAWRYRSELAPVALTGGHRSAPDFSHNGSSNAPHTHKLTPNAAIVTTTATSHLPVRLIVTHSRPSRHGRSTPQSQAKPGSGAGSPHV